MFIFLLLSTTLYGQINQSGNLELPNKASIQSVSSLPYPTLVGYWHNWDDFNAPYVDLMDVDERYNVINVSFVLPINGTTYDMDFTPTQVSQQALISQIQQKQEQGKKVLISIGGATATVKINNATELSTFVASMLEIVNTYGFDGIDIDLEGSSVSVSGGTILNPIDAPIINLIDAIEQIMQQFYQQKGKHLILTMAPETAYVQGGQSSYGGVWGAYLPIIDALRDSIDLLMVQLYNSGSMYGIDGGIYSQGTADFIISQTEAVLQGFNTNGGFFNPLFAVQVAVALPACSNAAGGGYISPSTVGSAMDYLLGNGIQPGAYTLLQNYPNLAGMMTWSVNWDVLSTCGAEDEYAYNFETIYSGVCKSEQVILPTTSILNVIQVQNNISTWGNVIVNSGELLDLKANDFNLNEEFEIKTGGSACLQNNPCD